MISVIRDNERAAEFQRNMPQSVYTIRVPYLNILKIDIQSTEIEPEKTIVIIYYRMNKTISKLKK